VTVVRLRRRRRWVRWLVIIAVIVALAPIWATRLVIDDRTKLVAKRVTEFLKESEDRFQKTIVFCVDQEHAARIRQALINDNPDLVNENRRCIMRHHRQRSGRTGSARKLHRPRGEVPCLGDDLTSALDRRLSRFAVAIALSSGHLARTDSGTPKAHAARDVVTQDEGVAVDR
jgi:hypothetical protein